MFSTFADVFATDDTEKSNVNGTSTDDVDPFGISSSMKLSASSQRFEDSPFVIETSKFPDEPSNRSHTGREIPQWNVEPTTFPSGTFDPLDDFATKTSGLSINNITHSKSINLIDPFLIPTTASNDSSSNTAPDQASPIDLLYDLNVDPSTLTGVTADKSLAHSDQVQSSYDLLGLNRSNPKATPSKVPKSDSLTDMSTTSQTKKASASSLMTKTAISSAASYHTLPTNAPPPSSPSTLRVQATALSIMTGTTSSTPFDDQFLDWLTQSDDLMCGVDPKLTGPSRKMDINMMKSTEDLLGSINRVPPPPPFLGTLRK